MGNRSGGVGVREEREQGGEHGEGWGGTQEEVSKRVNNLLTIYVNPDKSNCCTHHMFGTLFLDEMSKKFTLFATKHMSRS